jgi:hypothetical protein
MARSVSAAVLETNPDQLTQRIEEATNAMFRRGQELEQSAEANAEREEMARAAEALLVLKNDQQAWREYKAMSRLDGSGTGQRVPGPASRVSCPAPSW